MDLGSKIGALCAMSAATFAPPAWTLFFFSLFLGLYFWLVLASYNKIRSIPPAPPPKPPAKICQSNNTKTNKHHTLRRKLWVFFLSLVYSPKTAKFVVSFSSSQDLKYHSYLDTLMRKVNRCSNDMACERSVS